VGTLEDFSGLGFVNPFRRAFFFVTAFSISVSLNIFLVHTVITQNQENSKHEEDIQKAQVDMLRKELQRTVQEGKSTVNEYIGHLKKEDSLERIK